MTKEDLRAIVVDREGDEIAPIPQAEVSTVEWVLVEPGGFDLKIDPLADNAGEILLLETEVQVWDDTELIHWGVPWSVQGDVDSLTFKCDGVLSLFRKRYIDNMSLDYDSVDQAAIAWDLLSYAQGESVQANRDLNVTSPGLQPTGIVRSPRYNREEHENILDAVREFPKMTNGFEYSMQLDPAGHGRWWTVHYPRKGSLKAEHYMRYEVGKARNIARFTYRESADEVATNVYATGASDGLIRFEQEFEDIAASARFGVMQEIVSEGSQKDLDWLLDRAEKEVTIRKVPKTTVNITSVTTKDLKRGDVVEGDWLPVSIDYGRIQANDLYRVNAVKLNENRSLTFTFEETVAA